MAGRAKRITRAQIEMETGERERERDGARRRKKLSADGHQQWRKCCTGIRRERRRKSESLYHGLFGQVGEQGGRKVEQAMGISCGIFFRFFFFCTFIYVWSV